MGEAASPDRASMRRFDCFPFNNELDMLECRLTELEDVVDIFVLVEADVTHGANEPKPLHYHENRDRFERWADRIVPVVATGLPTDIDAWSREHAQREWIRQGLEACQVEPGDLIFQSDVDEIPRTDFVRYTNPATFTVALMDFYCFAVDWLHPPSPDSPWSGTVAAPYRLIDSFANMRDMRLRAPNRVPDAGWHFTWVGGPDYWPSKLASFCHPEIKDTVEQCGLSTYYEEGFHVDGYKCDKVTTDDYPRWIREGHAPGSWWAP